ncbi:hypothetical protein [Burkholderia multivorans]|uniref:hypothetical protein n=1 Tax=Burkholderia multivorans TaxID=87883 RepID=UPI0009E0D81B|nr:hypothetical protein [Burkholderia multivorans]MDN8078332.1 hypothetical protein [Burkholderia multivorans]SAJ91507.1 hypothetical protein UA11_04722 [Burkholderia multivorans]
MDEREMLDAAASLRDANKESLDLNQRLDRAARLLEQAARRTTPDREAVIEECAKVCDSIGFSLNNEWNQRLGVAAELSGVAEDCADAIRALPTIPTSDQGD